MEREMAIDRPSVNGLPDARLDAPIRVMVIGGGIAGMSAALQLAKRGFDVSLYEGSHRLGGKAGANLNHQTNMYDDHGFHIFPAWYRNIWKLIDEDLQIRDDFVDLHDFFQLRAG